MLFLQMARERTSTGFLLFPGNSHKKLAEDIARRVDQPLANLNLKNGDDGETSIEINDSVRGKDVFIIQTGSGTAINDYVMELLIMAYACKTSSANRIIGVIPYLPYSRQSKLRNRGCITAKLLASMMTKAGMNHIITIDLHHKEIQGFFDIPVDNLRASAFIMQYIREHVPNYHNAVIVARHPGVTYRASSYAERLRLRIAVIHGQKEIEHDDDETDGRNSPPPMIEQEPEEPVVYVPPTGRRQRNDSSSLSLLKSSATQTTQQTSMKIKPSLYCVGDVQGRIAIIVDDVIDEVGELIAAAECLKENGAYKIYAAATHGVLSKNAPELINQSPIDEVLITNTVPTQDQECRCKKIKTIDISILLTEAVRRIYNGESMSYLFRNIPMEQ